MSNNQFTENDEARYIPRFRFANFKNDEGWDLKEFENYIKLYRGSSPRPIQEYLTRDNHGINWIKIGDTKNSINSIIYNVEERITPTGAEKSRSVKKGELILANSMSYGKTYELAIDGCIYDGWFVLREFEKNFYKPFLLQLLNSNYMQQQYKRLAAGGIVQNISSEIVYKSLLPHTSLKEQQKIASCLCSIDELIQRESKKLEAYKQHKNAILARLFPQVNESIPKLRFDGFKENWKVIKFIDLTDKNVKWSFVGGPFGSNLKSSDYTSNGIRIIQLQNIGDGKFLDSYKIYTSVDKADELLSNNIYAGDIILSKMGDPVARACFIPATEKRCVMCSDGIRLVVDQKKYDPFYVFSYINQPIFRNLAENISTGSTRKRISLEGLKKLLIITPSLPEQQKIARCLSSLDDLITHQTDYIKQLKQHKKGLMQQLFPMLEDASA